MSLQAFRLPNPTNLAKSRTEAVFEDMRRKFQSKLLESNDDVRGAIYEALRTFFLNAAEPSFDGTQLPANLPRERGIYSEAVEKIAADLLVAYQEAKAISDATASSFNFQTVLFDMLEGRLRKAGSTLLDLQIANDRFNEAIIVAGDDFTDTSRVDFDADLGGDRADVQTLGNLLTLKREGNESPIIPDLVTISVEPLQGYRQRLYEGQFYGLQGQAAPEAGQFHFVRKKASDVRLDTLPEELLTRFRQYVSGLSSDAGRDVTENANQILFQGVEQSRTSGSFAGFSQDEWEILASNIHSGTELQTIAGGQIPEFPLALDASMAIIDQGAPLPERQAARLAMVDGDPDTFWQIEYTFSVPDVDQEMLEGNENDPERIGFISQALLESFREFDATDLDVRVRVDLGMLARANWIDLVPVLFEGVEHLEILNIETSTDSIEWEKVPNLREGVSGNRIARDTNEDLSPAAARTIIAPNSSAFAGRGLWAFPPRVFRYLRIDIRQPVPVLVPYQRLNLKLQRTVTRRRHRRSNKHSVHVREIQLSYPETVLIREGEAEPGAIAGASAQNQTRRKQYAGKQGGRTVYGAESIIKEWITTHWDKGRYAVAIQDLSIWAYRYAESSEIISVPFRSPEPISKIALEVDELIPQEFNEGGLIQNWIQYWVAVGDSQEWLPIAPNNNLVTRQREGGQLPVVLNVNSGIPVSERNPAEGYVDLDHDVDTVRFRAVLTRPLDLDDAESLTPILKSYRLLLTVRGGFR